MNAREAARHVGLPVSQFIGLIREGKMPRATWHGPGGEREWDRRVLPWTPQRLALALNCGRDRIVDMCKRGELTWYSALGRYFITDTGLCDER